MYQDVGVARMFFRGLKYLIHNVCNEYTHSKGMLGDWVQTKRIVWTQYLGLCFLHRTDFQRANDLFSGEKDSCVYIGYDEKLLLRAAIIAV